MIEKNVEFEKLKQLVNEAELKINSNTLDNVKITNLNKSETKVRNSIICVDCNEVFRSKSDLDKHVNTHNITIMTQIERAQILNTK